MKKAELNGKLKSSVRVTLRISKQCSEDIVWLANYYRITQKDLFEKLAGGLLLKYKNKELPDSEFFEAIFLASGKKAANTGGDQAKVRKAQVVSSTTHKTLNALAKKFSLSRDTLIEHLVLVFKMLIQADVDKMKDLHKSAQTIIDNFWGEASAIEKRLTELLGKDDPVVTRFDYIMIHFENLLGSIEKELTDGIPVDSEIW